jgi:hypothetical protein
MAKLPVTKKPIAKPGAKLAPAGAAKKPGKALAVSKKPKEPAVNFKENEVVEFVGYANIEEGREPMFEAGDRLLLVGKKKDPDNNQTFFQAIKEEDAEAYKSNPDDVNGDEVYAAEIKKAPKVEADPYALAIVSDAGLEEILANYDNALEAAKALQEDAAKNIFYMGGVLQSLYAGRSYLEYGKNKDGSNLYDDDKSEDGATKKASGWDKFCQENFNEGGRKCLALMSTYRAFAALGDEVDLDDIASNKKLGWVKLAAMAPVIKKENAAELIGLALSSNVNDFRETVRTDYVTEGGEARSGSGNGAKVKRTTYKIQFFEDQAASVDYVVAQAAKEFGVEPSNLNAVFERIIMDWASQNLSEGVFKKARSAKKSKLRELKAGGVDIKDRQEDDAELEDFLARSEDAAEPELETAE